MTSPVDTDRVSAIVFDCDGVLVDTQRFWSEAQAALFRRHGRRFSAEDEEKLLGTSIDAAGRTLARSLGQVRRSGELSAELYELIIARVREHARPMPGARALLEALNGRRRLGVASNSPRALLDTALGKAGFADTFDVAVGADEVESPKPAPDLYLRVCELLGAPPSETIAFEDSPTGVAAARAAGLFVVGVPSVDGVQLEADLVAESLLDRRIWSHLELARA